MATHFSGPVVSTNGFTGDITGTVTGNVTGNVTGYTIGGVIAPAATAYAADGAIGPSVILASLSKTSAGAYTLAIPGTSGITLHLIATTAQAHVVTVTGMDGGNTLTFGGAIGDNVTLLARTSGAWTIISSVNVVASTV